MDTSLAAEPEEGLLGFRTFWCVLAASGIASSPTLWGYTSRNATVVGRYSRGFAALLAAHAAVYLACLVVGLLPGRPLRAVRAWVRRNASALLGRSAALAAALALLWAVALYFLLLFMHTELGKSDLLHWLALGVLTWASYGLILVARSGVREQARALAKFTAAFVCAAALIACSEVLLRGRPDLLSADLVYRLPPGWSELRPTFVYEKPIVTGYRLVPGIALSGRLTAADANLYLQQRDLVRPIEKEQNRVLLEASFVADELGYRNASPLAATYPVAVSGDSYAAFMVEPRPWPQVLAEKLSAPVLNLGLQGYGPQAETEALIQYGLPRKPQWVILAYFEGNDLIDAYYYDRKKRSGLSWHEYDWQELGTLERLLVFQVARHAGRKLLGRSDTGGPTRGRGEDYPFPFTLELGGRTVELSFSIGYLSRHSISRETVERLPSFACTMESLKRLEAEAARAGAHALVVYCPTKEHCYVPLLPPGLLEEKVRWAPRPEIRADGEFSNGRTMVTAAEVQANLDGQRDALVGALAREGIDVLDLTPPFQAAARRGEALYLVNDTHWASAGHELAAATVAERLRR